MEVGIRVEAENIRTGTRRHTNSCYFTMVAVDDTGHPCPVPAVTPQTPLDQRRYRAAELRRELRREIAERLEKVADTAADAGSPG